MGREERNVMDEKYNSKILFDNIDFLIKSENRKIGEVESEAGVSAGYISRTSKDGGSKPGIEFIMNIAKVLNVSIDTLLKIDLSALTPTERYIMSFLEKLEKDTTNDSLPWERKSAETFEESYHVTHGNVTLIRKKLTCREKDDYVENNASRTPFVSNSFGDNTEIYGDCFSLKLQNHTFLYFMNLSKLSSSSNDLEEFAKEVWIIKSGIPHFLCSNYGNKKMTDAVNNLYEAVIENVKHPKIEPDIRKIIDSFMQGDIKDDLISPVKYDESEDDIF